MEFNDVKDSGERQEFNTGSVRDTSEGKGTPHLIAGEVLSKVLFSHPVDTKEIIANLLFNYSTIQEDKNNLTDIYRAISLTLSLISDSEDGSFTSAMMRLSKHYENGAKKYSKNNWRKGQPVSRYYDSAMRHLWKDIDNMKDEDHKAALLWNLMGIVQTKLDVKKGLLPKALDDFPFTIVETFPNIKND